ncbi:MAG: SDR family NAD(P)-dependent oxidoreductase [Myxococcales bacterium FL481]|nr:MAG: SDR family NAD(P)-dependent oxidoreductase [Myxococcales bacterium FL481]
MKKTILLTGATDGIGLETARRLATEGHHLLLHGRSPAKLARVIDEVSRPANAGPVESYVADLSCLPQVDAMATAVAEKHDRLDVLINNAGVFKVANPITPSGIDLRFMVNTIAPYLLTQRLLKLMNATARVVNLSSAAQSSVELPALAGRTRLPDFEAYAQSKLAITMWSRLFADELGERGPIVVAINPGSMLGTKMVKEGFGVTGANVGIGADILVRAALSDEFADASGEYFDNDARTFAQPHPDARDPNKNQALVTAIGEVLSCERAE